MRWEKSYRFVIVFFAKILVCIIHPLPRKWAIFIGGILGRIVYYVLKKERLKTIAHLNYAYQDEKSIREKALISRQVFSHLGKNTFEWIIQDKYLRNNKYDFIDVKGLEHLKEAHSYGKGVIALTGHFGNWELLANYVVNTLGYYGAVVAKKIYFEPYNNLLINIRKRSNVHTIYRDESPKNIIRVLKKNGIIGILPDQDVAGLEGVFVQYFKKPTFTPSGPVAIAILTGAPILPCFMVRFGYRYVFFIEPPIFVDEKVGKSSRKDVIKNTTQKWTDILEKYVREYPNQWVWNHKRWKTKLSDCR